MALPPSYKGWRPSLAHLLSPDCRCELGEGAHKGARVGSQEGLTRKGARQCGRALDS